MNYSSDTIIPNLAFICTQAQTILQQNSSWSMFLLFWVLSGFVFFVWLVVFLGGGGGLFVWLLLGFFVLFFFLKALKKNYPIIEILHLKCFEIVYL